MYDALSQHNYTWLYQFRRTVLIASLWVRSDYARGHGNRSKA